MIRLCCWLIVVLFSGVWVTGAEPAAVKLPSKDKFHIYLLMGQSNMAGRGKVDPAKNTPHPRVLKLDKNNQWLPATDPVHFDKPIAGVGIATTFGPSMAEANPDVTIGLVPCAVGGTPLARWELNGDLFQAAMKRAKLAIEQGTLKGVLWHQGEADTGKSETANSYGARLKQMIADLRSELATPQLPVVVGELSRWEQVTGGYTTVNQALQAIATQVPRTACVKASDIQAKPDLHFNADEYRELGRRYAREMLQLQRAIQ